MNRTTINELSAPLLSEILIRLDAKSAHRSKCVSRLWLSEISTPKFVQRFIDHRMALVRRGDLALSSLPFITVPKFLRHYQTFETNGVIDYCSDDLFGPKGFSLDFLPISEPDGNLVRVIGASNDLLLCIVGVNIGGYDDCGNQVSSQEARYYVCNPFTKEWVQLPPPPRRKFKDTVFLYGVASHPSYNVSLDDENNITCDDIDSHYRVVLGIAKDKFAPMHLEIFSSETSKWRGLDCSFEDPPPIISYRNYTRFASLCCGRLLWMHSVPGGERHIFSYDPFSDSHALIPLPEEVGEKVFFGVSRGRLQVLNMLIDEYEEGRDTNCIIRVWEMDKDRFDQVYNVSMQTSLDSRMLTFHPFKGEKVYMWDGIDHLAKCNLRKGTFQIKEWKGYIQAGSLFTLVKPWFPTPVRALTPT